jgi:hypothetical protein
MTWSKSRNSLNYSTSIFDDFWIFQTETWAVCTVLRESQKSGSYWRWLSSYWVVAHFTVKKTEKSRFLPEVLSFVKKHKRKKVICITWLPIGLGRPGLVMISRKRGSDFPLLGCYKRLLQKLVKSLCGKKSRARQRVWVIRAKLVLRRIVCIKCIKCVSSIQYIRCTGCIMCTL